MGATAGHLACWRGGKGAGKADTRKAGRRALQTGRQAQVTADGQLLHREYEWPLKRTCWETDPTGPLAVGGDTRLKGEQKKKKPQ